MVRLQYTLVADGPSDRALLHVIDWTIRAALSGRDCAIAARFAERESNPGDLEAKVRAALDAFPCDLLFIHRDAEKAAPSIRLAEVARAAVGARALSHVAVVPVRMTEAWLLVDPEAIRLAADQSSDAKVSLPPVSRLETLPDPKHVLRQTLRDVAAKSGRHHRRFARDMNVRVQRVAAYTSDFSPLRVLPSFQTFEADTAKALKALTKSR
jgi:hypothetical protein